MAAPPGAVAPDPVDPDELGRAYEAALGAGERRRLGAHYTPPALADELVALALDGAPAAPTVCDPACGGGAFLLAAGRALEARGIDPAHIGADLLWGCDLDPDAVRVAADAIEQWAGRRPPDHHLAVADGLDHDWDRRFDVVVGNPPFLNQLKRDTVRSRQPPPHLAAVVGAYTDTAWLFLLAAVHLASPGGRVVLLQPQSIAAARDAEPVRRAIGEQATLESLWSTSDRVFAASVHVCAPVLNVGVPERTARPWASLLVRPDPAPKVELPTYTGTVGSIATATAGFREQFYGLAPYVADDLGPGSPALVTSGLIDAGRCGWGTRSTRFAKRQWHSPRIDLAALDRDNPRLGRWVHHRLRPKVVVATQTRIIEAAVDVEGTWVPSTPVISVEPANPADLWRVAAVLLAPPISAWALHAYAGTALSPDAIKLSAKQVCAIPLPRDRRAWDAGADGLRAGDIRRAASAMNTAYGATNDVLAWWSHRYR